MYVFPFVCIIITTSPPPTGREWWTRKWNRPMTQCYCPCSCSRGSDWALTGKRVWSSWRADPSWSWGCCWTSARTGRLFGVLCSGAPTEGAGRFPPVVPDTPDLVPSSTETWAIRNTRKISKKYIQARQCMYVYVVFAHLWKFIIYVLQHLPVLQHQIVLSPGLSLLQLEGEEIRAGREADWGREEGRKEDKRQWEKDLRGKKRNAGEVGIHIQGRYGMNNRIMRGL